MTIAGFVPLAIMLGRYVDSEIASKCAGEAYRKKLVYYIKSPSAVRLRGEQQEGLRPLRREGLNQF